MNPRTFVLTDDQVDEIVVEELKLAYELNCKPNKVDCSDDYIDPDYKLLASLEYVLQYFMVPSEFKAWKQTKDNQ